MSRPDRVWSAIRNHLLELGRPLYRNAFLLMFISGVGGVLSFVFWLAAARFYSAEEVGFSASILSLAAFLGSLSSLGLGIGLIRYLPSSPNQRELIATSLVVVALVALAVGAIFLFVGPTSPLLYPGAGSWLQVALFLTLAVGFAMTQIVDSSLLAARDARFVLYRTLLYNLLKIGFVVAVVASLNALGILLSLAGALFVALAASLFLLLPRNYPGLLRASSFALSRVRPIFRYATGNHAANLLYVLPTGLLPLLVLITLSSTSAAHFYVAWILASFLFVIPAASSASLFIEGSHSAGYLAKDTVHSLWLALLLLIPGAALLLVGGPFLLGLFGVEYSQQGLGLVRILAVSAFFVTLNSTYFSFLRVEGGIRELIVLSGILGAGTLVGSSLLMASQGLLAPGIAFLGMHALVSGYIVLRYFHRSALVTERLMRV